MKTYLYPQNLKARANLWLWSLRDFVILCAAVLVSAVIFLNSGIALPGRTISRWWTSWAMPSGSF